jgi:outer membrane biosynthesis protein TonB
MEFDFKTSDSSAAPFTSETARVLGLLRKNSSKMVKASERDGEPRALLTKMPAVPVNHRKIKEKGEARVKFILSRRGSVELARVLDSTSPR